MKMLIFLLELKYKLLCIKSLLKIRILQYSFKLYLFFQIIIIIVAQQR